MIKTNKDQFIKEYINIVLIINIGILSLSILLYYLNNSYKAILFYFSMFLYIKICIVIYLYNEILKEIKNN